MAFADNPYAVTIGTPNATGSLNSQAIVDMQNLGMTWLRFQVPWSTVDPNATGNTTKYIWTAWDSAVSQCTKAGINIVLSIMKPPPAFLTQSCNAATGDFLPDPGATATLAQQIAQRYNPNGSTGHGTVQAIEVGNEDYDDNSAGASGCGAPCRNSSFLVPVMQQTYTAVKGVNSSILVGCASLLQRNSSHITSWVDTLLNPSGGAYNGATLAMDYLNFHYYTCAPTSGSVPVSLDPTVDIPSWNGGCGLPSVTTFWSLIHSKAKQYGVTIPIWITETGFDINNNPGRNANCLVSEATQWTYLQDVLDSARTSGSVTKVFIFTLAYYTGYPASGASYMIRDGQSLVQGTLASPHYTTAYTSLKTYITNNPQWSGGGGTFTRHPDIRVRFNLQSLPAPTFTGNPLGTGTLGMARLGDGKMTQVRGRSKTLPLSYTITASKYGVALPLTYTIQVANVGQLLLYYTISPSSAFAINGNATIIAPDRITYPPRPVVARTLLAEPIIQGYQVMTWTYTAIEPSEWAYLVAFYTPQQPVVTLTYPDDRGTWQQVQARMLPPVWGSWETMLVSGASLSFVIPSVSP